LKSSSERIFSGKLILIIFAPRNGNGMIRLSFTALVLIALMALIGQSCLDTGENIDPATRMASDIQEIDNYLTNHGLTAIEDKSGIRLQVTSVGAGGFPPRPDQQVKIKYKGTLLSGTVFEQSTIQSSVNGFILGWQRALPMLPKGSKATVYIPSGLAYGGRAVGPIPANSNLIFEIEMQEVVVSAAEALQAQNDITAIDAYLADNSIQAIIDTTGIRYTITSEGIGNKPTWYSKVKFAYTGKLLSNGSEIATGTADRSDLVDSFLVDYLNGIKVALMKLSKGGKGTFYIPSGLAFGANGSGGGSIPANANVVYEIELLEIYPD
jgi:FKBP-type peptidyl-prolyl cis-trans isomerase